MSCNGLLITVTTKYDIFAVEVRLSISDERFETIKLT